MELWGADVIGLSGTPLFEFTSTTNGRFHFVAVAGYFDGRVSDFNSTRIEFSWEGTDDGSPVSGRGWVEPGSDGSDELVGRIFIHNGDDSGFRAKRKAEKAPSTSTRAKARARLRLLPPNK